MNLPKYDIRTGETVFIYEFTSVGTKGSIQKMIDFQYTNLKDFYNLASVIKILSHKNKTIQNKYC